MLTVGLFMSFSIMVALLLTSPLFITRSTPFTPHPFRYTQAVPFFKPICASSFNLWKNYSKPTLQPRSTARNASCRIAASFGIENPMDVNGDANF